MVSLIWGWGRGDMGKGNHISGMVGGGRGGA